MSAARRGLFVAAMLAWLCGWAGARDVAGHELPQTRGIVVDGSGELAAVVTSRGVVVPRGNDAWAIVCRHWFEVAAVEVPTALSRGEELWFATSRGAWRGGADGCGWARDAVWADTVLTGLREVRGVDGVRAVGVASGANDGAVRVDEDWAPRVVVPSGAERFVASVAMDADGAMFVLFVGLDPDTGRPSYDLVWRPAGGDDAPTRDLGNVPLGEDDVRVLLAGVDHVGRGVLVTTRYEETGRPAGIVAVDPDGQRQPLGELPGPITLARHNERTWLGSEAGLFTLLEGTLELRSDAWPVHALVAGGDVLYGGSAYPLGPMVARWDDGWVDATPFEAVRAAVACDTPAGLVAVCRADWEDWQLDVPAAAPGSDAGGDDAGLDAGATDGNADGGESAPAASGGGCSVGVAAPGGAGWVAFAALAALAPVRRRGAARRT